MLSYDQALAAILKEVDPIEAEVCELRSAHQRVLARDIIASIDIPPFNNSSMDGYAVRADDTREAGPDRAVHLAVDGEIGAGDRSTTPLRPGFARRIFTGGMISDGADAVIEQEKIDRHGDTIVLNAPVTVGKNVRIRGEDVSAGQKILERGMRITAARLGILASLGLNRVHVGAIPKVGILTTGNELVDVDEPLKEGKIHDSNSYTLSSLVSETGCVPVQLGRATDATSDLREKIQASLALDVLITSGGVSVGDRDLVLETLKGLGAELKFWKVNIKPGMPVAFCVYRREGKSKSVLVFALPGNPVSTMVTFLKLARPALRRLQGLISDQPGLILTARLEEDYDKSDGKRHFARGIVRNENGELVVRKSGSQSSGVLNSLSVANCLMVIPEHVSRTPAGTLIEIELLRELN